MLILKLLIVSYIACHGEGKYKETRGRSKYYSIIHQNLRKKNSTVSSTEHDKNIEKDKLSAGISRNNPEINRIPKTKPQLKDKHSETNTQGMHLPMMRDYGGTRRNQFNGRKEDDSGRNTEASWNHFIYKMNADAVSYPFKTKEVQREVCKTLPFTQNIIHKNCDKVVIQNNLCFGKCNSLHVPNQRDELNICSRCLPFKFTMNHLKLNCTGSGNVDKVIMMVEECKCVIHSHNRLSANNIKDTSPFGKH